MSVKCTNCGTRLPDNYAGPVESRPPCPNCGSTARTVEASGKAAIRISGVGTLTAGPSVMAGTGFVTGPGLALKAIIVPGAHTNDGRLIETVAPPWFDIIEILQRDPAMAQALTAREWEEIIAGAYRKAGFEEVTLTPRSGDGGRDIIAVKHGIGSVRIIDQVKAYKPGHLVTADEVRALFGVLVLDRAAKGFVTTTSDFAPKIGDDSLLKTVMPDRLELVNGETLMTRLAALANKKP